MQAAAVLRVHEVEPTERIRIRLGKSLGEDLAAVWRPLSVAQVDARFADGQEHHVRSVELHGGDREAVVRTPCGKEQSTAIATQAGLRCTTECTQLLLTGPVRAHDEDRLVAIVAAGPREGDPTSQVRDRDAGLGRCGRESR